MDLMNVNERLVVKCWKFKMMSADISRIFTGCEVALSQKKDESMLSRNLCEFFGKLGNILDEILKNFDESTRKLGLRRAVTRRWVGLRRTPEPANKDSVLSSKLRRFSGRTCCGTTSRLRENTPPNAWPGRSSPRSRKRTSTMASTPKW